MENNKSIVNTITTKFLLRLAGQDGKADLATNIRVLLGNKEKPKSDEFLQIFENHVSDGGKAE
jgi:hypothetical protein